VGRWLLRALEQLLAIDDLHDAALVGPEREIDAVALRAGGDKAMDCGRHCAGGAGLLTDEAEVAGLHWMGWIAEVVDLRHARAPAGRRRDQIGDATLALPVILVGIGHAEHAREHFGLGRISHVPGLVAFTTERAQEIDLVRVTLAERLAV